MRQLFKLKEKLAVGLDIGTHAVKLVELRFAKDTVELCNFDLVPIQTGLSEILKTIVRTQKFKEVNISVSGPATIIRYVDFPRMKEEELKQSLKFEAQKHIPFSIEEINLDGRILKHDFADNKMLVLLAAVKKEFMHQRLKIIQEADVKVDIVDIDSIALINAFNFNYSQDENLKHKTVALLNIGASLSNLNILEGSTPRLSRDIQIAGNNFTQKISDALSVDFKSAEKLKLNPDKERERADKVLMAVESVLSNLANEIRVSFDYYESQNASSVAKIFLCGGSCLFAGLKDILANLLSIEVECWDPLKAINISDKISGTNIPRGQFGVSVGLALRKY